MRERRKNEYYLAWRRKRIEIDEEYRSDTRAKYTIVRRISSQRDEMIPRQETILENGEVYRMWPIGDNHIAIHRENLVSNLQVFNRERIAKCETIEEYWAVGREIKLKQKER